MSRVLTFPESSRGGPRINHAFVAGIHVDGGNASAHSRRANAAEFEVFKEVFGQGLGRELQCCEESEGKKSNFHKTKLSAKLA